MFPVAGDTGTMMSYCGAEAAPDADGIMGARVLADMLAASNAHQALAGEQRQRP